MSVSVCISLYQFLSFLVFCNSLYYFISMRVCLYKALLLCIGYQFVSVCISLLQFVSVCVSLNQPVSACISLYQFPSVCVSLYQSALFYINMCPIISAFIGLYRCLSAQFVSV